MFQADKRRRNTARRAEERKGKEGAYVQKAIVCFDKTSRKMVKRTEERNG